MNKNYFRFLIITCVAAMMVFAVSLKGMAYKSPLDEKSEIPFSTSKTDRTLIKEVLVSQQEAIALLRKIETMLQEKE